MKVLVVGVDLDTFVMEQCNALKKAGVNVFTHKVTGHGPTGYLKEIFKLQRAIKQIHPDLIHAHYGLSGLCANFQRKVPVVTTYHGSDIHSGGWVLKLSRLAMRLSSYNIFVSEQLYRQSEYDKKNACIISCGIDLDTIQPVDRKKAKEGIGKTHTFVLFASSFSNNVKNPELAKKSMSLLPQTELVELKGYNREEVNLLMNAADCLLVTSHREGGPLVVKEAMACGTPIVSVDVGDVKNVIGDTAGCYIAERNPEDIARKIKLALNFKEKTRGRQRIVNLGLDNDDIAKKIIEVYQQCLRQ